MSKKFYLVKEEQDPITGGSHKHKYMGSHIPGIPGVPTFIPNTSYGYPNIVPMQITKSQGLTISPQPPLNFSPQPFDFNQPAFGYSSKGKSPAGNFIPASPFMMGAPIMKYGAYQYGNGTITITFGNNIATLNIPYNCFRNVVNDIYNRAFVDLNPLEPKISVRISGMGIDTIIQTTLAKIHGIISYLNTTYNGIQYNCNGAHHTCSTFLPIFFR
jgi:hypothetical protein